MKFPKRLVAKGLCSLVFLFSVPVSAPVVADNHDHEAIRAVFPDATDISETPVEGLLEVRNGYQLRYVTPDGKYEFAGHLVDIKAGESVTERRLADIRKDLFADVVDRGDTIDFLADSPSGEVLVFTDISCGYCRKLHGEMSQYNDMGISVRYLAFPRMGEGTETWKTMESIWCSDNRQASITLAKNNLDIEENACGTDSVSEHFRMGRELGLTGTPMIMTSGGQVIPGYVPPANLSELLQEEQS